MKMRVLLSTPYDLAVPGGVNQQALGMLDALTHRGITARLIGPASEKVDLRDGRVEVLGRVSQLSRNGAVSRVTFDFRVIGQIRKILREFAPTVIHVHEPVVPLIGPALLALAPTGVKRVGTFHTYSEKSLGYLWAWPWCHWLWSRLDERVAVSPFAREFATRFHRSDFRIIPNGADAPQAVPVREFRKGRLSVLFIGRMDEPRKGFGLLLGAVRRLAGDKEVGVELTVVGRGHQEWEGQADGLPVTFKGELNDADREEALAQADALILPSLGGESFGVVGLEAMLRGLPVVAARLPAYADWMGDAALYFTPGNEQGLANVCRWLAYDPELLERYSQRGRAIARRYEWPRLMEQLGGLYGLDARAGRSGAKLA